MIVKAIVLTLAVALFATPARTVRDLDGVVRQPLRAATGGLSVVFFVLSDCPISNAYAPEIQRICQSYRNRGVSCHLVYAEPTLSDAEARAHAHAYSHDGYPLIVDRDRTLVRDAGVTIAPEAVVADVRGTIAYRGRIDDAYAELGKPRRVVQDRSLRNALDALLDGRPVAVPQTQSVGCYLSNTPP